MPRNDLSLASKIALLDKIKSQPPNTSYRRLAEITGVPKSTISRVLQQESQLREEFVLHEGQTGTSKRKREGKDPDVEKALDQWFTIVSGTGVSINGPILKAKAEEFAKKLGRNNFKATSGWLSRWKARHNIKFKKAHSEKANSVKDQEISNSEENEDMLQVPINPQEFLTIENNSPYYDDNEDCEDSIVEDTEPKHEKLDEDESPLLVTNQEAKKCIAMLQRYFMQEGNEGSPISALNTCADFVEAKSHKNKTDYT